MISKLSLTTIYSLYVVETYNEEDAALIIDRCEKVMLNRGFIQFSEFNQSLVSFYAENREINGEEIYRSIFSGKVMN